MGIVSKSWRINPLSCTVNVFCNTYIGVHQQIQRFGMLNRFVILPTTAGSAASNNGNQAKHGKFGFFLI
ncbi:hypothetical protein D3C85_1422220 [compost metagenome]